MSSNGSTIVWGGLDLGKTEGVCWRELYLQQWPVEHVVVVSAEQERQIMAQMPESAKDRIAAREAKRREHLERIRKRR
jgi:hypothetical protein